MTLAALKDLCILQEKLHPLADNNIYVIIQKDDTPNFYNNVIIQPCDNINIINQS